MAAAWLAAVGCAASQRYLSPTDGYLPLGEPAEPLEVASAGCRSRAEFRDAGGLAWTSWERFEACMQQRGWVRR